MYPRAHLKEQGSRNIAMRRPVRISITLPESAFQELVSRSTQQGRSISNLAAFLLERGLDYKDNQGCGG